MTDNIRKKVICYNCHGEGHVSRQCKEKKRVKDSQYFKDKMLLMEAKEKGTVLDARVEAFLADVECTTPYDQPLAITTTNMFEFQLDSEVQDVPTEVSSAPPGVRKPNTILDDLTGSSANISMVTILDEMRDTLDEKTQENQDLSLENQNLTAELAKCKLEIVRLDTQQVKLDLERQVRQEQNLVTQRNERNAELEQEKVMLKTHLKSKDVSIEFLKSENQKVLTDKKKLEDKYLDEIVCLKSANKVATDLLQKFQMPTHTIPMLSKKPKNASQDLHKDILGRSNPRYGKKAPVINASNAWDTDETLASAEVSMAKMKGKPGHVRPESGFYEKLNALKFVPQQELSREQVYWLPANEIASQASTPATPVTPYVPKSPPPSQVLATLHNIKAVFPQFDAIIKERTTVKPLYVSLPCYEYAKEFALQQVVPFLDYFKKHVQTADDTIVKEVAEFKEIHYALEDEYERCVLDNKNLIIEKKNLLIKNDSLIAECLERDICSIVLYSDVAVTPSSNCSCDNLRLECDREHNKLKDQLQGKDDTIRNLQTQINITRMLNVGSTVGSFDKQALETELTQLKDALTSVRIQIVINALTAENAKLKTELSGKMSSGFTASEKPKVLASGMYTIVQKYNHSKKSQLEQTLPLNLVNYANKKPHREPCILTSKSVNARKAADHNKKLHVVDHNQFVIRSLKSVIPKTPGQH
ncbi:retrotransposon protein, putative, ty1-copia subclass [Tanacetum coccineum]